MKKLRRWLPQIASFVLLVSGMAFEYGEVSWFHRPWTDFLWYLAAFLPVGIPVAKEAVEAFTQKDFFNEFTLMLLASVGAFFIGEYPEAVAVMLFYAVGEELQEGAVRRSRRHIRELLEMHPEKVRVWQQGRMEEVDPRTVEPGRTVEAAAGERLCLDGELLDDSATLDTAALTGESLPRFIARGEEMLAGYIVLDHRIRMKVLRPYSDSAMAKMARLVEEASKRKAPTEIFIRRVSRIYTPVVIGLAVLVIAVPALVAALSSYPYDFSAWLYRALVFLVISCPCALVVGIPLTYFAGIGAASRQGILFKGGNGLDAAAKTDAVVFDKTGTLTSGAFRVVSVQTVQGVDREESLSLLASAELSSRHPVASAVTGYLHEQGITAEPADRTEEKAGFGMVAKVRDRTVLAGSAALLRTEGVEVPQEWLHSLQTVVLWAVDGIFTGAVQLSDSPKEDAIAALEALREMGVVPLAVLSGDTPDRVNAIAARLGIEQAYGGLLPQDKVLHLQEFRKKGYRVAFAGDGINDAPVLAASDLGVAMGGKGSDAAIETADMVLQTDQLLRLPQAISLARRVRRTVWQNIALAFGVKIMVLTLGVFGIATLWGAVFADTGVALLAVLNAVRGVSVRKDKLPV